MRSFKFVVFLLFATPSFGQSALDIKYSTDVCACLDSVKITGLNEENFLDCFQKAMQQNTDLILQEVNEKYGDSSEASGYKFGKDLAERAMINLVGECRTYFVLTDSMRYGDYKNLNQDSLGVLLKNLNNTQTASRDEEFYSNKALLFFALKNYDSSLFEIEKSLNLEPNNFPSLFLKGWINEIKGNYDEAIILYNKLAELTHMNSYYIFSEVAKRKKNGR